MSSIAEQIKNKTRFRFDFPNDLDLMGPSSIIEGIYDELTSENTQTGYTSASELKKSLLLRLHTLKLDLEKIEEEDIESDATE